MTLEKIIKKEEGIKFVELFADYNPIHTRDNIVQGMYIATIGIIDFLSILRDKRLEIESFDIKFKLPLFYNQKFYFEHCAKRKINDITVLTIGYNENKDECWGYWWL